MVTVKRHRSGGRWFGSYPYKMGVFSPRRMTNGYPHTISKTAYQSRLNDPPK